jgi:hypothetical protein
MRKKDLTEAQIDRFRSIWHKYYIKAERARNPANKEKWGDLAERWWFMFNVRERNPYDKPNNYHKNKIREGKERFGFSVLKKKDRKWMRDIIGNYPYKHCIGDGLGISIIIGGNILYLMEGGKVFFRMKDTYNSIEIRDAKKFISHLEDFAKSVETAKKRLNYMLSLKHLPLTA